MKLGTFFAASAGLLLASTVSASAITYATSVDSVLPGVGAGLPGRDDPDFALGAEDLEFYALGLGGQIVIDPAPMPKKDRRTFETALRQAFKADAIETALVGWTPLGHYELQRRRLRAETGTLI